MHCGFCTATCPTYVTLGNELDSPRGRIYLIKDMLENGRAADEQIVTHIDRCLSCLACMTTCPSGVNYMHLVDHARAHIEKTYRRPVADRLIRAILAFVLPQPGAVPRGAETGEARPAPCQVFRRRAGAEASCRDAQACAALGAGAVADGEAHAHASATGRREKRVAILTGCAQAVLDPGINEAAIALLTRLGVEVVVPRGEACCGALVHHMGREEQALASARRNIDAWTRQIEKGGLDAILITASGCGTTIKDYGFMLRLDPAYAEKAARVSALAKDITEFLATLDLPQPAQRSGLIVAYHSACSMQHGQKITRQPKELSRRPASSSRSRAKAISAAALPAPTTSCSQRFRRGCATAR